MARARTLGLLLPLIAACNPEFDNRFSTIDALRVLAVQSSPAQVAPSKPVSYRILAVDDTGTIANPQVSWSYCTQAKPVSELNDVATACFGSGDQVKPFASGSVAAGVVPANACRQFGPDLPETKPGEPAGRPTDPDSSGGYYQPVILSVRAAGETIPALAETRISCGLANSTGQQFEDYQARSKANQNPQLLAVVAPGMGDAALGDGVAAPPLMVQRGTTVVLRASWPACPAAAECGDGMCTSGETVSTCPADCTTPIGCAGPEEYAYLDPALGQVVDRHESMRVSWFATQGEFQDDHTGRLEAEFATTSSDNSWRAPPGASLVFMWVVLRDDRGGVDWKSFQLQIE